MSMSKIRILQVLVEAKETPLGWRHYELPRGWVATKHLVPVDVGTHRFGAYIDAMRKEGYDIESKKIREAFNLQTGRKEPILTEAGKPKAIFIYRLNTPENFIDWETGKLDQFAVDIARAEGEKQTNLFEGY